MGTALNFMNIGIGIAVCLGVFFLMYVLTDKSHAKQSKVQLGSKKAIRQPWDGVEKTGGRGIR